MRDSLEDFITAAEDAFPWKWRAFARFVQKHYQEEFKANMKRTSVFRRNAFWVGLSCGLMLGVIVGLLFIVVR